MTKDVSYYKDLFAKMKRNKNNGLAPHKPVLLLSVINMFESRVYSNSHIFICDELVDEFDQQWVLHVTSPFHRCKFTTPFFHMGGEPFWRLVPNQGYENDVQDMYKMYAYSRLVKAVKWAEIDEELALLLLEKDTRIELRRFLIESNF